MIVAIVTVALTAAGLPVAIAIGRGRGPLALAGLAFLYGTGSVYAVLLLLSLAGIGWSMPVAVAGVLAISAAAMPAVLRRTESGSRPAKPSWIDAVTALVVAAYGWTALLHRPLHIDFQAIWGLKGRMFFDAMGVDWIFLQSEWNAFAHPDYPLLLPFNYAFTAIAGGGWDDRWLGGVSVAYGVALLLIVRSLAAEELSPHVAAAVTLGAAAFALSPQIGLAEAPVIAYGTSALLLVRKALLASDYGAMRHGAILLGLAAVTKNEGVALCVAAAVAIAAARAPLRWWTPFAVPVALIGSWMAIRAAHSLRTDLAAGDPIARVVTRLGDLPLLTAALVDSISRPLLWLLLLVALALLPRTIVAREKFMLITVALQLLMFIAAYLVTPYDAAWHVASSWERISRQAGAPLLIVVMLALAQTMALRQDHSHAAPRP